MITRLTHILGSLVAVIVAYVGYALIVVPFIEPAAHARPSSVASEDDLRIASDAVSKQRRALEHWFQPGDWELSSPKILETAKGKLLLKEYKTLGDDQRLVQIIPFTMILIPEGEFASTEERDRQAVVLRVPAGAELEFDSAFDIKRGKVGKLIGGKLLGEITIHSDQRLPGTEDDLHIVARDFTLENDRITSPHPLKFRFGPNYGTGKGLTITLAPGTVSGTANNSRLMYGGVTGFELASQVEMRLFPGGVDMFPGKQQPAANDAPPVAVASKVTDRLRPKPNQPVEVRCRGSFNFDLQQYLTTFKDQVVVLRVNAPGPSDQLTCELLRIYFEAVAPLPEAPPEAVAAADDKPAREPKLKPIKLEALGSPVILQSPSSGVHARGEHLEYNLKTRGGSLRGKQQVIFRQDENEIHARELEFEPDGQGRLAKILALGPGWLKGMLKGEPAEQEQNTRPEAAAPREPRPDEAEPQPLSARWTKRLQLRPFEGQQVLSVEGDARVEMAATGALNADEIHLWMLEVPTPPGSAKATEILPQRLLATDDTSVVIDSPQLVGRVKELGVWFKHRRETQLRVPPRVAVPPRRSVPPARAVPRMARSAGPSLTAPPAVPPLSEAAFNEELPPPPKRTLPFGGGSPRRRGVVKSRYSIDGDKLHMQVLMNDQETEITQLQVTNRVRFAQLPAVGEPVTAGEEPLLVLGSFVHLVQPSPLDARLKIVGQPAYVSAKGLELSGGSDRREGTIHLDRRQNRMWIAGPGQMSFLLKGGLSASVGGPLGPAQPQPGPREPSAAPSLLTVEWHKSLDFDGLLATFDGSVAARTDSQQGDSFRKQVVRSELMEVALASMVEFGESPGDKNPEVDRIACRGTVKMDIHAWQQRHLVSHEQMQTGDVTIYQRSGELHARGPGELRTIRFGNTAAGGGGAMNPFGNGQSKRLIARPVSNSAKPDSQPKLMFMGVRFLGDVTGNLHLPEVILSDQVRAVYGPVANWTSALDPDNPQALTEGDMLMLCDKLSVAQGPPDNRGTRQLLLTATGNTSVENGTQTYKALAQRLTYEQAKDLLVLDGDGGEAQLLGQERRGGQVSSLTARKIRFRPSTYEFAVEDVTSPAVLAK